MALTRRARPRCDICQCIIVRDRAQAIHLLLAATRVLNRAHLSEFHTRDGSLLRLFYAGGRYEPCGGEHHWNRSVRMRLRRAEMLLLKPIKFRPHCKPSICS